MSPREGELDRYKRSEPAAARLGSYSGTRGRRDLRPGACVPGPAVIVEDETSTVVSRLFAARINAFAYIELTRNRG
jgi:N-methylhydantoinase A/oxoprolinase/acetone carboxylase beta subunit